MTPEDLERLPGYQKFRDLLNSLLQVDLADLDFGIYRVLRQRKDAIEEYFASRLPRRLAEYLKALEGTTRADLEARLEEIRDEIRKQQKGLGLVLIDESGNLTDLGRHQAMQGAELLRRYVHFQQELANYALAEEQVNDILLLLKDFLGRYYQDGDFIPAPRFVACESYALDSYNDPVNAPQPGDFAGEPYRGEEVYFHWASRGMHYVKTDSYLKTYSFEVKTENLFEESFHVCFMLSEVEPVTDNNKTKRFFFPKPEEVRLEDRTLVIPFDYRTKGDEDAGSQKKIFDETLKLILDRVPVPALRAALERDNLLRRRLTHFAALGTKDFFVHPSLQSFLLRELDYFIKSQALRWAEVEDERVLSRRIAVLRAFRGVAEDLIRFLAQLETLQARLFEKKRLVYQTDYIVPVRFVPRELWPEVLANKGQVDYWRVDMGLKGDIDEATLETHPTLPVYTGHFGDAFKRRLLQSLPQMFAGDGEECPDLDELTDGILIHSENYGALRTFEARYRGAVKVIYIDPPYNTGSDGFLYKDGYRHSTWLTMMEERLRLAKAWMREDAVVFVSIDDNECHRLKSLCDQIFGEDSYLNTFVWINNLKGRQISGKGAAKTHEYILAYARKQIEPFKVSIPKLKSIMPSSYKGFDYDVKEDEAGYFVVKNELYNTNSRFNEETRPNLVFNIHYNFKTGEIRFSEVDEEVDFEGFVKIPPKENNDGVHRYHAWRWSKERILKDSTISNSLRWATK